MPVSIATRRAAEAAKALRCHEAGRAASVITADDALRDIFHYYRMMGYDVEAKIAAALERYRLDLETEDLDEAD